MMMELYAVKINGLNDPVGYLFDALVCSWKVRGAKGEKQANAKIEVSLRKDFSDTVYMAEGPELSSLGTMRNMSLLPST